MSLPPPGRANHPPAPPPPGSTVNDPSAPTGTPGDVAVPRLPTAAPRTASPLPDRPDARSTPATPPRNGYRKRHTKGARRRRFLGWTCGLIALGGVTAGALFAISKIEAPPTWVDARVACSEDAERLLDAIEDYVDERGRLPQSLWYVNDWRPIDVEDWDDWTASFRPEHVPPGGSFEATVEAKPDTRCG